MRSQLTSLRTAGKEILTEYTAHQGSLAAGGMAYFVLLAIAPAAVAFGAVAGAIIGPDDTKAVIESMLSRLPAAGSQFQEVTNSVVNVVTSSSGTALTLASVVGLLIAIYAASKAITALRIALDRSFGFIGHDPGLMGRVRDGVITLVGLLLMVAVVLALTLFPRFAMALGFPEVHFSSGIGWIDWMALAFIVWLLVLALYRWAPSRRASISWRSPVAIGVAVWLLGATAGVGLYVGFSSTLGAAIAAFGAPMVVLLWLYLSFMGVLIGAEIQMYRVEERPTIHD